MEVAYGRWKNHWAILGEERGCHYRNLLKIRKALFSHCQQYPTKPWGQSPFSVFASRITRNLALKKYEYLSAEKRKPEAICSFEELGDCVSGKEYVESEAENRRIEQLIDTFLCQIGEEKRNIFLCRYWYFDSIEEICRCTGYSQSKIKSMLFNIRKKLRGYLESEGVDLWMKSSFLTESEMWTINWSGKLNRCQIIDGDTEEEVFGSL